MIIQREDPGLRCRVRCVDVKQFNNVGGIFNKTAADWWGKWTDSHLGNSSGLYITIKYSTTLT